MGQDLELTPIDIETTGFSIADEVTVVGFDLEIGCRVFVQAGGRSVDVGRVEDAVYERAGRHLVLSAHESERALLVTVWEFVGERLRGDDVLLVGYNGDTWQGGFDLPFLRSRGAKQDVPWAFTEVPYADLLPVVSDRFNTAVDGESVTDLGGVYAALCSGRWNEVDPFTDSEQAVTAFEDGAFVDLVAHNVADIARTKAIGRVTQRYCSKSEFDLKSLTPVIDDA